MGKNDKPATKIPRGRSLLKRHYDALNAAWANDPDLREAYDRVVSRWKLAADFANIGTPDLARDAMTTAATLTRHVCDLFCRDPVVGRLFDPEGLYPLVLNKAKADGYSPAGWIPDGKGPLQPVQIARLTLGQQIPIEWDKGRPFLDWAASMEDEKALGVYKRAIGRKLRGEPVPALGKKRPASWRKTADKYLKFSGDHPDLTLDQFARSYTNPPVDRSTLSRWVAARRKELKK